MLKLHVPMRFSSFFCYKKINTIFSISRVSSNIESRGRELEKILTDEIGKHSIF